MRPIKTKQKLDEFRQQRKTAREILRLKIFEDVHEIKRIDRHVEDFIAAMRDDIKNHRVGKLQEQSEEFEHEVHEELDRLIDLTRQDLELYLRVMKSLKEFKRLLKSFSQHDPHFERIAQAELEYADVIRKGMHHKLDALNKVFKRLRQK